MWDNHGIDIQACIVLSSCQGRAVLQALTDLQYLYGTTETEGERPAAVYNCAQNRNS